MKNDVEFAFVYSTFPDLAQAERVSRDLVGRQLAACVNILPGMISIYRWQGGIERGEEVVAIFKTRAGLVDELISAGVLQHPYETPAFVVLPVAGGSAGYLEWLAEATRAPE